MGLRLLTAKDIIEAQDLDREEVPTPEWGEGTGVLVQAMTAAQRLAWEQTGRVNVLDAQGNVTRYAPNPNWDNRTALVICTTVDAEGEPLFTVDDLDRLQRKSAAPIDRIADVARRLSRIRPEDASEGTARLKATTAGDSHSASA